MTQGHFVNAQAKRHPLTDALANVYCICNVQCIFFKFIVVKHL